MSPSFRRSLPMLLNYTLDGIMPAYRNLFAQFDLTEQQWRILRVLWSAKSISSAELSKRTLLTAPSLVGILDRLEKKQLVERVRSETDRRTTFIQTTDKGSALQQQILPLVEDIQSSERSSVTEAELEELERILMKITNNAKVRGET